MKARRVRVLIRRTVIATLGFILPALLCVLYVRARVLHPLKSPETRQFTVRRGDVVVKVAETGTVQPLTQVEVKSKVGGKVLRLLAQEGDRVRTGQVLAVLDPIDLRPQVGQIQAQVAAARAHLAQAEAQAQAERRTVALGIAEATEQQRTAAARLAQAIRQEQVQPGLTRLAIAQAEANAEAARQALVRLNRSGTPQVLADAQSNLDQAQADAERAEKERVRQKALLARGFVPQSAVDDAEHVAATDQARLRDAQAHEQTIRDQVAADRAGAEAQLQQTEAALATARANAVQDELRREDASAARAALQTARVGLDRARADRRQIEVQDAEVAAARAGVTQLESSLTQVETQLHDTVLHAPMDGVVTRRYVEAGELVTSGIQTFSSGTPVMQIAELSHMQVQVQVNEVDVARLKVGQRARIELDATRGTSLPGRVTAVAPAAAAPAGAQPGQPSSGGSGAGGIVKFDVKIDILRTDPRLRPGMTANVDIVADERRHVLVLPLEAVDLIRSRVWKQVAGRSVATPVRLGLRDDNQVEILSGLRNGDRVLPARYSGPPRRKLQFQPGN